MVLRLCKAVELLCLPVRNIFQRISLHDLPYHKTIIAASFPEAVISGCFSTPPAEILDSNMLLELPTVSLFCLTISSATQMNGVKD